MKPLLTNFSTFLPKTVHFKLLSITATVLLAVVAVVVSVHSSSPPALRAEATAAKSVEKPRALGSELKTRHSATIRSLSALEPLAPVVTATKTDALAPGGGDVNSDGNADPGDTLQYTVTINASGEDATGVTFTDTVDPNTAFVGGSLTATPVAIDDSYTAAGNIRITVAAPGVLGNDYLGVPTATITSPPTTSTQGGNVSLNADGSFTYNPPPGFEGSDTFSYTLTNSAGSNSGTVTINVSGMIWFINNTSPACTTLAAGCGRLTNPFSSLPAFAALNNGAGNNPAANDNIFLYESATDYVGPVTLLNGQRFLGQDATASLSAMTGVTPPAGSDPLPATNSGNGIIVNITSGNAITVASGNTLRGFTGGNSTTDISGTGFGTLTISDVTLNGTGQALNLTTGTLAATFGSISSTNSGTTGISLNGVAGSLTTPTTTITNPTGIGISVGTSSATLSFGNTTSTQSGGTGVSLASNSGPVTFADLDISPDIGQRSLHATNNTTTGTITSTSGTINGSATTNAATFEITGASAAARTPLSIVLDSITGTNDQFSGINLNFVSGNLTVGTTSVTNPGGIGIQVLNTASGTMNFGATAVNSSSGIGVRLGVAAQGNAGNITFSALDIAPDAGQIGLQATDNAGTITSTSGDISTSGATGVEITRSSGTTPLAISLTSVTVSGGSLAPNGIFLSNTSGSFTVTGNGGACTVATPTCTGGRIQLTTGLDGATSGTGVRLNNATNVSLSLMRLNGHPNFAIYGNTVNGFTLTDSYIHGVNGTNAAVGTEEGSVSFDNLVGSASISGCDIDGGKRDNLRVVNTLGSLNRLTVSNTTIRFHDSATGNDAVHFEGFNAGTTMNLTVSGGTFKGARGDMIDALSQSGVFMDIVIRGNSFTNEQTNVVSANTPIIVQGTGTVTYDVSCNKVQQTNAAGTTGTAQGHGINVAKSTAGGSFSGTIFNNTIGKPGVLSSGAGLAGAGIQLLSNGTGTHTSLVKNNIINNYGESGIRVIGNNGNSTTNVTIIGNVTTEPNPTFGFAGLFVDAGAFSSDSNIFNVKVGGSGAEQNDFTAGDPFNFSDISLNRTLAGGNTVQLNLTRPPSASNDPVVVLQDNNTGTPTVSNSGTITLVNTTPPLPAAINEACTPPLLTAPVDGMFGAANAASASVASDEKKTDETADILRATKGERLRADNLQKLTQAELMAMMPAAVERWREFGISIDDLMRLQAVTFEITDLPDGQLATATSTSVRIDETAAGYGWYSDVSPMEDSEFDVSVPSRELQTTEYSPAFGRMDLLTVVMRELGVAYRQGKKSLPKQLRALMEGTLSPAVRRLPDSRNIKLPTTKVGVSSKNNTNSKKTLVSQVSKASALQPATKGFASPVSIGNAAFNPSAKKASRQSSRLMNHAARNRTTAVSLSSILADVSLSIGTLPAGESVTITFNATINSTFTGSEVCNQGTVSGTNFSNVLTDDPTVGGTADPTCTPVDQPDVTVAVSPGSVAEDGATNLVYTFTREGPTTNALTVNFSVGGTANPTTDYAQSGATSYTPPSGTVTFGAGNSTAVVTIDPATDTTVEPDETVILTVTSGTGYEVGSPSSATGTITNDDTDVSVAVSPGSVSEDGGTNLVYTFTRNGVTSGALTVNFSVDTGGNNATFPVDYAQTGAATYTPTSGTVTFAALSSTATVTIDPTPDVLVEPDETVVLTVTSGTGYNVGSPSAATGTITNDDAEVSVAVAPSSVAEDGVPNLVYTFTRTGSNVTPLTVNFSVGGTASFNQPDYTTTGAVTFTETSGTVTFAALSSTATVTVDPAIDFTSEPDETVILTVTSGTGYSVGSPDSATGTITNDDTTVSVAVTPGSVAEDGATNLVYTFTRNDSNGALTANFAVGGTASFTEPDYSQTGADTFNATSGTVTFANGSLTATVTVDPAADTTVEPDETVILTVTSGAGYAVGSPASATGTITNDDAGVSVAVSPGAVDEDGVPNLVYTFTRTGIITGALTVNFSVGGTASFTQPDYTPTGADTFSATSGTVTFGAGNATTTVTVNPSTDATVESDETVILTVVAGSGYNVGSPSSATGTITNDDTDVTLAVAPSSVNEDGLPNLVYTFTRNGVTSGALTVNFSVGGTASFTEPDYTQTGAATFTASSGTVIFGAGNSTATVTVDPSADATGEPDETVILTVTTGTGYNVGSPSSATGTIVNDDTTVSVAVSPSSVAEDGATNLVYTFTRNDSSGSLTANFSVGGTASFTEPDYTQTGAATFGASAGTVTFANGSLTATVTVNPTADSMIELDETVILTVTAGSGYVPGSPASATGTITNDDTGVSVAVSPGAVDENGVPNLVYTFTRTGVISGPLTVNFSVGGTASFTQPDYTQTGATTFTATSGTVTFGAGNATATVTVDPSADTTVEPDETVILTVVSGAGYQIGSPSSATGTITNDDTNVTVAVSPTSVTEDGVTNLVYTFTRNGVTSGALTVNFSIGAGVNSATFPTDYTQSGATTYSPPSGSVTFGAGNSTATVTVDPTPDLDPESSETVTLTVIAGAGYNVGSPSSATGTIQDDEAFSLVFTSERNGNKEIYIIKSNGTGLTRLTNHSKSDFDADLSPDGTKVAFVSTRNGENDIYVVNADGSGLLRLTTNSKADSDPVWSPDNSKIAFVSKRDGNEEIYVMNANGTSQRRLTNHSKSDANPGWSPDSTKIVFESERNTKDDIYVVDITGTGVPTATRLTTHSAEDRDPTWSPDGSKIAFVSKRDGNEEIYVMNANGTSQRRLTSHSQTDNTPYWSPDSQKIVFHSERSGDGDIYVIDITGTGVPPATRITTNSDEDETPIWSPDGSKIVYQREEEDDDDDDDTQYEIFIMNPDGTEKTNLSDHHKDDKEPSV